MTNILIIKILFYNVVHTSSKISPLLRLLLKVSVWYICQKRIEKYYQRTNKFLLRSTTYQNTGWVKKNIFVIFALQ